MSRLKLAKKLKPAKKAWKSISNKIQSKVRKLNIPRAIKTTLQRLLSTFHSLSQIIIPSKIHRRSSSLTTPRPYATSSYYNNYNVQRSNFAAIRIDDLYAEAASVSVNVTHKSSHARGETSNRGKEVHGNYKDLHSDESGGVNTMEDAWKVVVAKSPMLHVDQKAEEFIQKFREDMRLQKERSMLEYQEMLARSA